jgi:hypothetical protein
MLEKKQQSHLAGLAQILSVSKETILKLKLARPVTYLQ